MKRSIFIFVFISFSAMAWSQITLPQLQPLQYKTTSFGNALNFDGTDDYVSTATSVTNPQNFTLSAWVYPKTCSVDGHVIRKEGSSFARRFNATPIFS
jgi:hypothetical protein